MPAKVPLLLVNGAQVRPQQCLRPPEPNAGPRVQACCARRSASGFRVAGCREASRGLGTHPQAQPWTLNRPLSFLKPEQAQGPTPRPAR